MRWKGGSFDCFNEYYCTVFSVLITWPYLARKIESLTYLHRTFLHLTNLHYDIFTLGQFYTRHTPWHIYTKLYLHCYIFTPRHIYTNISNCESHIYYNCYVSHTTYPATCLGGDASLSSAWEGEKITLAGEGYLPALEWEGIPCSWRLPGKG